MYSRVSMTMYTFSELLGLTALIIFVLITMIYCRSARESDSRGVWRHPDSTFKVLPSESTGHKEHILPAMNCSDT